MKFSQIQHKDHSESGKATPEMDLISSVQVIFRKKKKKNQGETCEVAAMQTFC